MSSLAGTYSNGQLLSPDEQALMDQINALKTPQTKIDFSPVLDEINKQPPPQLQQVPGTASPLGVFLSLLAGNVGAALTRNPSTAAPTQQVLQFQREEQARIKQENTDAINKFNEGLTHDKLSVMLKQQEMELEQAINNRDKESANTASALIKILDSRLQAKNQRALEAQRSADQKAEDAAKQAAEGARQRSLADYYMSKGFTPHGGSTANTLAGNDKWPQKYRDAYNKEIAPIESQANAAQRAAYAGLAFVPPDQQADAYAQAAAMAQKATDDAHRQSQQIWDKYEALATGKAAVKTVKMAAPTGETMDVPEDQVAHYQAQGAKVVK